MEHQPRFLLISDDPIVVQAADRLALGLPCAIEASGDAAEVLEWAAEGSYAGVILDTTAGTVDADAFLDGLLHRRPDVVVVCLVANVEAASRLTLTSPAVVDCLLKPVSSEDLGQALHRLWWRHMTALGLADTPASSGFSSPQAPTGELLFWHESWCRRRDDGSLVVGVVLPFIGRTGTESVILPDPGDVVFQGLPLAAMVTAEGVLRSIPSPVSGVVVAVNRALEDKPGALFADPCGAGWIAELWPTRPAEELAACRPRRVVLLNSDAVSGGQQSRSLAVIGCQVHPVRNWSELVLALPGQDSEVLIIDASSLGENGPELVPKTHVLIPETRIIVVASPGSRWEPAYRRNRVFYYAVEPFADGEIVDILDAAFQPVGQAALGSECRDPALEPISGIRITNRDGDKVRLLAVGGLLQRGDGLGAWIRRKLQDRLVPFETIAGETDAGLSVMLKAAGRGDRLIVLQAKDTGALPGVLFRDARAEIVPVPGGLAGRMTVLVVQPDVSAGGLTRLDGRTAAALAEHLVNEMTLPWRGPRVERRTVVAARVGLDG